MAAATHRVHEVIAGAAGAVMPMNIWSDSSCATSCGADETCCSAPWRGTGCITSWSQGRMSRAFRMATGMAAYHKADRFPICPERSDPINLSVGARQPETAEKTRSKRGLRTKGRMVNLTSVHSRTRPQRLRSRHLSRQRLQALKWTDCRHCTTTVTTVGL